MPCLDNVPVFLAIVAMATLGAVDGAGAQCPGEGNCCGGGCAPGCDDDDCCESVCADDPFCCDVQWDQFCVDLALADPSCPCGRGSFACWDPAPGNPGPDGPFVWALVAVDGSSPLGPALYAGGTFETIDGVTVNNIAKWDGCSWQSLDTGVNGTVYALEHKYGYLFAGGGFTEAGGTAVDYTAYWDGTSWHAMNPFGYGPNDIVTALRWTDASIPGGELMVGGYFTEIGGQHAERITIWHAGLEVWFVTGSGAYGIDENMNAPVYDIETFDGDNYACGSFTEADGITVNHIAKGQFANWDDVDGGANNVVLSLETWNDGTGEALYAGGIFTEIGGVSASHIAKWDGSNWSALGSGVNSIVHALTSMETDCGNNLYVGGTFTTAGGISVKNIARWDGSSWSSIGELDGTVWALDAGASPLGYAVFAGGDFEIVSHGADSFNVDQVAALLCCQLDFELCGTSNISCLIPHDSPGCQTVSCCNQVCAVDSFCCESQWDFLCVQLATDGCGLVSESCGQGAGPCLIPHQGGGCGDEACCMAVCEVDATCCDQQWDQKCVSLAQEFCDFSQQPCGESGDCCAAHASPGCEDATCCSLVCALEPLCCESQWDGVCVAFAMSLCCEEAKPQPTCCDSGVKINEIRATHPPSGGADGQEYFELRGDPGTPLDCMYYLVIGPGGVVEEVESLSGHAIQPDGLFLVAQPTFNPALFPGAGPADLVVANLNFINNGNRTHLLCCDCDGPAIKQGTDLDKNDDGVFDSTLWDCQLDCIALIEDPHGPPWYCPTYRGPTLAGNAPAHVWRCTLPVFPPAPWRIGPFPLPAGGGGDTPGAPNPACAASGVGAGVFAGIAHEAIGAATLDIVDGDLVVGNLGPAGIDGVALQLGAAEFACVTIDWGGACGTSATPAITLDGVAADGTALGEIKVACIAPDMTELTANFLTDPLLTVQVFDDGEMVFEQDRLEPEAVSVIIIQVPCPDPDDTPPCYQVFDFWSPDPDHAGVDDGPGIGTDIPDDSSVTINGGAANGSTVVGDYVVIRPSTSVPDLPLGELRITGENMTEFTVLGEALGMWGHPHVAAGPSLMVGSNDDDWRLEFFGIDGQGNEGFGGEIHMDYYQPMPNGVLIGLIVFPNGLEEAPVGSALNFSNVVKLDGTPTSLADLSIVKSSSSDTLVAINLVEMAPLITGSVQVQYFNDAGQMIYKVVASDLQPLVPLNMVPAEHLRYKEWIEEGPSGITKYHIGVSSLIRFETPGGLASEVSVCIPMIDIWPNRGTSYMYTLPFYTSVAATGGLTSFEIVGELPIVAAEPTPCPSDLNGDGNTGPTDLADSLASWGKCPGCPADITGDGHVDAADLANLLAGWGDCS